MSLCFFREIENEFTFEKCVTFRFRITKVWKRFERKYINFAVVRIRRNKISVASIRTFRRMKILRKQSFAFLLLWKRGKRNGNGIEKRFKVIRLRTGINQENFFDTNFSFLNTKHPVIYTLNSNRYWFIIKYYEYAVPIARDATRLLHLLSLRRDTDLSQTRFQHLDTQFLFFNFQNSTLKKWWRKTVQTVRVRPSFELDRNRISASRNHEGPKSTIPIYPGEDRCLRSGRV